jgi:hypothetical protein
MQMKMIIIFFLLIFKHFVDSEGNEIQKIEFCTRKFCIEICQSVNCGSGICKTTQNPTLPYYCQCSNGSNSILPCPSESLYPSFFEYKIYRYD